MGKMKKEELIFELHSLDVDVNPKLTVEELRHLLRWVWGQAEKPTGLATKNLAQLTDMAKHLGMRMPAKPTRGLLMRMIRDMDVECVPVAPPKPTARAAKKPATSTNSSSAASTASFEMVHQTGIKGRRDQNPPDASMPSPEALSEVQLLEQQLALTRQKHGMTAAHQPEVNGASGGPLEVRIASDDELASEAPARTRARGRAE